MKPQQIETLYQLMEDADNHKSEFESWDDIEKEIQLKISSGLNDLARGRKQDAFEFLNDVKKKYGIKA